VEAPQHGLSIRAVAGAGRVPGVQQAVTSPVT
jgi:hypothetical protein